ncbi:ATP-grasp domain-containing protein, partial [Elusimicrobiota bacterium]
IVFYNTFRRGKRGTLDPINAKAVLIMSEGGGVQIESTALASPESIIKYYIDINDNINEEHIRGSIDSFNCSRNISETILNIVVSLYSVFTEYECETAEINPLVITSDGDVVAADARISIYDEAAIKYPEYMKEEDIYTDLERTARRDGLGYVEMDGDIGVIGNGAGLNMATLDILTYFGGRPANFLEVSGRTYHKAQRAVELVLMKPGVKILFGNFFGCISRCDVIAQGLACAFKNGKINVPVVISMRGTGAAEGINTLRTAGLKEIFEDDIEAGRRVVHLLGEL